MKSDVAQIDKFPLPTIGIHSSVAELLRRLSDKATSAGKSGILFVVSDDWKLLGVVTDSDIRRYLSKNMKIPSSIQEVMVQDFVSIEEGDWNTRSLLSIVSQFDDRRWENTLPIRYVPVTRNEILTDLIDLDKHRDEVLRLRNINVVVGLGYVGLTLALTLAASNGRVVGIDNNPSIINGLLQGKVHIEEPGILGLLRNVIGKTFHAVDGIGSFKRPEGVACNFFLCIGTPKSFNEQTLSTDSLIDLILKLGPHIKEGDSIIMRSTVPIGTGRRICEILSETFSLRVGEDFYYISAPERTVEGNALKELQDLPQLLAGMSAACTTRGEMVFKGFTKSIVLISNVESCELAKVIANAFRDYSFAFSNYLAAYCRQLRIDVDEIIESVNIGYDRARIPKPSPGVGGPCLTKDPYLLNYMPHEFSADSSPVILARKFNETVPLQVANFICRVIPAIHERRLLIIGLAFKGTPEVRDLRNSSPVEIARILQKRLTKQLIAIDAVATLEGLDFLPIKNFSESELAEVSVIAILNNHPANRNFADEQIRKSTADTIWIFDPWRLLNLHSLNLFGKNRISIITMSQVIDVVGNSQHV